VACVLAIAFYFGAASCANAAVLFQYDFEGASPTVGTIALDGFSMRNVSDAPDPGATNDGGFAQIASSSWLQHSAAASNQTITVEFDAWLTSNTEATSRLAFSGWGSSSYTNGTYYVAPVGTGAVQSYGAGGYVSGGNIATETWQHVTNVVDYVAKTQTITAGSLAPFTVPFRTDANDGGLNSVAYTFISYPASFVESNPVYVDNIKIYTGVPVPEPSAIILLSSGLMGLLAYAWRKRR
jgi:hypothetical protein